MMKKILLLLMIGFFLLSVCGCSLLVGGAVGGAGTAVWLAGKLSQEVNATFNGSIKGAKYALRSFKFELEKEAKKEEVAQLIANHSDGRKIWIDIHRVSDRSSRIEIRVGAAGDQEAARKIMDRILRYI